MARVTEIDPATIHGSFRRIAATAPAQPALLQGREVVTYGDLNAWSDAVAAQLADRGVGPGHLVPVTLSRSPALVAGLLGVLKTGAAYAVLDLAWGADRLRQAAGDLQASFMLGPGWEGGPESWLPARTSGLPVPADMVGGRDAASVFFTSGTSGTPKGALVPHAGTVLLFRDCPFVRLDKSTRMLQAAALPWDGLTLELWSVLTTGGSAYLPEREAPLDGARLAAAVAAGVTTAWLTASVFNLLVDEDPSCFAGLRHVLTGGERLSPAHVARFLALHGAMVRLTNGYGPAEATVFVTTHEVTTADLAAASGIPIGEPVPHTELQIEGEDGPVSPGEVGELVVAGPRIGLGYLGAAPAGGFLDGPDGRTYRTGDLVSRVAGTLHFHGRADRQLKIRGRRVEPQEIEFVASRVPGVGGVALVAARSNAGVAETLVLAYTGGPEPGGLRALLRDRLPDYLVPERIVRLSRLPTTAHGKLDERAILAHGEAADIEPADDPADDDPAAGPAGWSSLQAAVEEVLPHRAVAPTDTWWGLGGTSLDLVRLAMRLSRRLGRDIASVELAEAPVMADMVEVLARAATHEPDAPGAEVPADAWGLTDSQAGFVLQHEMGEDDSALCPMIWEITGQCDPTALGQALVDVSRRHGALSAAYVLDPRPEARLVPGAAIRLETLVPAADGLATAVEDRLYAPVSLEGGVVGRAVLARTPTGEQSVLGVGIHHVAFDGWSEAVFARDLSTAYAARRTGRKPAWSDVPAPPPGRSAAAAAGGPDQRELVDRWAERLDGAADIGWLDAGPGACADGHCTRPHVSRRYLGADIATALRTAAASGGRPLFVVLLGALAGALRRASDGGEFAVGIPMTTRSAAQLDSVDCLIDVVAVRMAADPGGTWTDQLATLDRELQWCHEHRGPAMRELRLRLRRGRGGRNPIYQVMFAFQEHPEAPLEIGMGTRYVRPPTRRPPVELLVEVVPDGAGGLEFVGSRRCQLVDAGVQAAVLGDFADLLAKLAASAPAAAAR